MSDYPLSYEAFQNSMKDFQNSMMDSAQKNRELVITTYQMLYGYHRGVRRLLRDVLVWWLKQAYRGVRDKTPEE
jgi:hypothetical protein